MRLSHLFKSAQPALVLLLIGSLPAIAVSLSGSLSQPVGSQNLGSQNMGSQNLLGPEPLDRAGGPLEMAQASGEAAGCKTVTDAASPTQVRAMPNPEAAIVGQLQSGTSLTVSQNRQGWLELAAPVAGWVALDLTRVTCGEADTQTALENIRSLGDQANQGDKAAVDLLVRYLDQADGAPGELALGKLADLAAQNPDLLIAVLDQQPAASRQQALRLLHASGVSLPESR